jgi:branched-chain amino acid transport system ATP-binding protein
VFELHGITAGYGDATVVRNVSLAVPAGSVVALLGANGAGKTTVLRVASGLMRPREGRITLEGRDLTGATATEFAQAGICHVPEGRGIFRALSVRENIVLQARPGGTATAMDRATSAFPVLGKRLGQVAGTMSGGEQQMLALARAYVSDPRVILLDEVSLGLAPRIVDEIFEFLHRLAAAGAALLLVEQYVVRALDVAHYVFMLNRGRVTFAGEPSELDAQGVFAGYTGISDAVPVHG